MSDTYEEILGGEVVHRLAPSARHETICGRLQRSLTAALESSATSRILTPRTIVSVSPGNMLRPDLALVTAATGRIWLAIEVIDSADHRSDTVAKKSVYEEINIPRLWMVDPRYDNVEVYHASPYGLRLKGILAGNESLSDPLLPGFSAMVAALFTG